MTNRIQELLAAIEQTRKDISALEQIQDVIPEESDLLEAVSINILEVIQNTLLQEKLITEKQAQTILTLAHTRKTLLES